MIFVKHRLSLFVLAMALAPIQQAWPQAGPLQGACLEDGSSCAGVFVATRRGVAFKRPASAFAPAFIVSGRQLSTPLATCRLVGINASGDRRVARLHCTTSVATDTARLILSPATDGGVYRYHSLEGGIATRYQRCIRESLKNP